MYDDDAIVFDAVAAAAVGYLLKDADGADIVAAIRAAAGQAMFGSTLVGRMQSGFHAARFASQPFPDLTDRKREILDGAAGLTSAEIGARLFLSSKTIANVSAILEKVHDAHRAEAIAKARAVGLGRWCDDPRSLSPTTAAE